MKLKFESSNNKKQFLKIKGNNNVVNQGQGNNIKQPKILLAGNGRFYGRPNDGNIRIVELKIKNFGDTSAYNIHGKIFDNNNERYDLGLIKSAFSPSEEIKKEFFYSTNIIFNDINNSIIKFYYIGDNNEKYESGHHLVISRRGDGGNNIAGFSDIM